MARRIVPMGLRRFRGAFFMAVVRPHWVPVYKDSKFVIS